MKKIIRNILKGVSLTAALFVFQACYGTPQVPPTGMEEDRENLSVAQGDEGAAPENEEAQDEELAFTGVPQE